MRMLRSAIFFAMMTFLSLGSRHANAWQDLHPDFVRRQVELINDPKSPLELKRASTWALASVGRASVDGIAQLARSEPRLLWTCVNLLDLIRTTSSTVELFSSLLDGLPGGVKDSGELRGFVGSRLEDMLGRKFPSDAERRTFVADNARYLVFDPTTMRYSIDEEARKKKQPMLHYPYAPSAHAAVDLAFWRFIIALHLQQQKTLESMVGPDVKLLHGGRQAHTRPELDIDAFADPLLNHRALSMRDEGKGRWLVRTGDAYFFFDGEPLRCVKAGMKPIE